MTRIPVGATTTSDYREATWDAWNRLRRIKKTGSGSTSGTTLDVWYDYDGLTRRTQKRIVTGANQGTVSYYYNSNWKCLEEYEGSNTEPTKQYVYGVRGRNDLILRDRDTNGDDTLDERLYALTDAMGSVTAVTDTSGDVKQRYSYRAFGPSEVLNPDFTAWTSGTDYDWQTRFHGEQRDAETGYYNYGYRYYLPELGRWPSRDPIEEEGGVNLYGMLGNDAVNHQDYNGLRRIRQGSSWSVKVGTEICGDIVIEDYSVASALSTNARKSIAGQISIRAVFYPAALKEVGRRYEYCCCKDGDYRWINTVTKDTAPGAPNTPYADLLQGQRGPYYDPTGGSGDQKGGRYIFVDKPTVPGWQLATNRQAGKGAKVEVEFKTKLVCASENNRELTSFEWGFSYSARGAGGTVNRHGFTYLDLSHQFSIDLK
jgi:RHS repeat-associated protein